ncbi:MAG: hypothetical protein ACR2NN_04235 [Bryobacteraceae bacterium]
MYPCIVVGAKETVGGGITWTEDAVLAPLDVALIGRMPNKGFGRNGGEVTAEPEATAAPGRAAARSDSPCRTMLSGTPSDGVADAGALVVNEGEGKPSLGASVSG